MLTSPFTSRNVPWRKEVMVWSRRGRPPNTAAAAATFGGRWWKWLRKSLRVEWKTLLRVAIYFWAFYCNSTLTFVDASRRKSKKAIYSVYTAIFGASLHLDTCLKSSTLDGNYSLSVDSSPPSAKAKRTERQKRDDEAKRCCRNSRKSDDWCCCCCQWSTFLALQCGRQKNTRANEGMLFSMVNASTVSNLYAKKAKIGEFFGQQCLLQGLTFTRSDGPFFQVLARSSSGWSTV